MDRYFKNFKTIAVHSVLVAVIFFAFPVMGKIAPNLTGRILTVFTDVFGPGSDLIITINLIATLLLLGAIYHYRALYHQSSFLQYLLLEWIVILPNRLNTFSGWVEFLERIRENPLADFAIFPVLASVLGILIFAYAIVGKKIADYLESTEAEREAIRTARREVLKLRRDIRRKKHENTVKKLRKELYDLYQKTVSNPLRYVACIATVVLFVAILIVLYYAIKQRNTLSIFILICFAAVITLVWIIYYVLTWCMKVKKASPNSNKGSEPGSETPEIPTKTTKTTIAIMVGNLLCIILIFIILYCVSGGSFDFSEAFRATMNKHKNTDSDVLDLLMCAGFVANFIGIAFTIMVLLFGCLLLFALFKDLVRWASDGAFPKRTEAHDNVPQFFRDAEAISRKLMTFIVGTAEGIIDFAGFTRTFSKHCDRLFLRIMWTRNTPLPVL